MSNRRDKEKKVESHVWPLITILQQKYKVDFYQREYVWEEKQMQDLIEDLSEEFLRNWDARDSTEEVAKYDPYYMGEIVLSKPDVAGTDYSIIDGQQRITSLTLILIYLRNTFKDVPKMPLGNIDDMIYSDHYGVNRYNLNIPERRNCIDSLYKEGKYEILPQDSPSVKNIVERYSDIGEIWNEKITEKNVVHFAYWLIYHVLFSRVETNDDHFAYVIFESMNDRGLSLTQVEMLRSFLLANVDENRRSQSMAKFDKAVERLSAIHLNSRSKATFEFFKIYFRGHYAENFSQSDTNSDFVRIGKEFHRWVYDCTTQIGLTNDHTSYVDFIDRIFYFSAVYEKINDIIAKRQSTDFFYLIVNEDYNFTLQPALILSAIRYLDNDEIVDEKIRIVSRHITKILSWRIWNQNTISQSSLEAAIYQLCHEIRDLDIESLKRHLAESTIERRELTTGPVLNQQNKKKIKVLLALITEIVARESGESNYILNSAEPCEVEHIIADHYEQHQDEFSSINEFVTARNSIGDLLVLPKSFNASYGDKIYEEKVKLYFSQNILAQSLNRQKYQNNPGFLRFIARTELPFVAYDHFGKKEIDSRADLYKRILQWNWDAE